MFFEGSETANVHAVPRYVHIPVSKWALIFAVFYIVVNKTTPFVVVYISDNLG